MQTRGLRLTEPGRPVKVLEGKSMTRQQRWQEKMKEEGRCVTCGKKASSTSVLRCKTHLKIRRKYQKDYWTRTQKAQPKRRLRLVK